METFIEVLSTLWAIFLRFWHFQLYKVESNVITLGTLVTAIVLILVGYLWARRLSHQIAEKILKHFNIERSVRASITQVIFYVLIIVFTLFVLHMLNVPLTIFTVVGGALAIGFGLGAQNIMNNFISGLVIMAERPVRVGDMVEVDGLKGVVEEIGTRATKVKSESNTHIVVPNSSFLQQNVLNWTLSDNIVRNVVSVGVAYGSDTQKVQTLMEEVVNKHPKVMKFPEPRVLFSDFADSSLAFDIYYFCYVTTFMDLKIIKSDLRYSIDQVFREHEIAISFPQRDVHLYTEKPLSVTIEK